MLFTAIAASLLSVWGAALGGPVQGERPQTDLLSYSGAYFAQPVTASTTITNGVLSPTAGILTATTTTTTATVGVTATATLTQPLTQPTPVPIVSPEVPLQWNPLDWNYLTGRPEPPMGPFSYAALALMLATLGVGAYFYFVRRPEWKKSNTVHFKAANRFAQPAIWLGVVGLLLIVARVVQLDFFNLRFWLYLWLLGLVALGAWFFLWYRGRYPKEMAKFTKVQRQKQYMSGSGKVTTRTSQPIASPAKRPTPVTPVATGDKPGQVQPDQQKPVQGNRRRKKR